VNVLQYYEQMTYQFLIDGNPFFEGNMMVLLLSMLVVLALVIFLVMTIIRKLRYNEGLKYEFITIIAHKFRTPLTSVKWLCESLLSSAGPDQAIKEGLSDIKVSTDKLIALTGTLIELTNTDSETKATYQFEDVSLNDLVRTITNSYKNIFHEKNIFFSINTPAETVFSHIDKSRMEFVLQTLLENAFAYTPPGRNVDISLGVEGKRAIISVHDNGIGIEQREMPHIFGKFYRTQKAKSADTEGFGVGLYLAQTIVRRHNGKISAFSEGQDRGSTFTISLPTK
jgi:signal transduction histidine kinase